ncbi:MAG: N-acetylmuramoyl-L-alanine amidase [Lachnospiraceae bacterium]|nr:N-acetylmuramoyl-L-alanine amidase [Lachnospiraceae bacterium]
MAKVIIDAGHGGMDPGAVYEGRMEKNDTLNLALAVGDILKENGVDVVYTRTDDVYDTPFEKAQIANREGGDFLLSIHRNSSPEPNQYSGVESLVYDKQGRKVQLAENINSELERAGFRNLGVKERPNLIVLKRSKMPAVLVEAGFLNTDADNALFDERFGEIAEAIADGVLKTLREDGMLQQEQEDDRPTEKLYRVQTGAYRNRAYAEDLLYRLQGQNFPAYILLEDGLYKVQVGAYRQLDNAVRMEEALRDQGYSTFIAV